MRLPLLIACSLAAACYRDAPRGAAPPPANTALEVPRGPDVSKTIADPLGFLPIDSELVASLDNNMLRNSELGRQYEPMLVARAGAGFERFKASCGFDPIASTHTFTLGVRHVGDPHPDGVLVVQGMDRDQLMGCLRKHADPKAGISLAGSVATVRPPQDANVMVFQFVDATTVVGVIGPQATEAQLAEVIRSGAPLRRSPAFMDMYAHIDTAAAAWLLVNGNSRLFDKAGALGFKPRGVFGSVTLTSGLAIALRLRLATAQEATALVTTVQGQLGAARMFFDKLDVTADDTDVVFDLAMSSSQVQTLLGLLGNFGVSTP